MKKAFELSVSMLIVIVLAFAILGFGLYFINKLYSAAPIPEIPQKCDIYPPSASSPLCITSDIEVARGKEYSLKVSLYNDEDNDIGSGAIPMITCSKDVEGNELLLKTASSGAAVSVGETEDYSVIVKIPKDAARGKYPCNILISETEKQFIFTVN